MLSIKTELKLLSRKPKPTACKSTRRRRATGGVFSTQSGSKINKCIRVLNFHFYFRFCISFLPQELSLQNVGMTDAFLSRLIGRCAQLEKNRKPLKASEQKSINSVCCTAANCAARAASAAEAWRPGSQQTASFHKHYGEIS